MLVIEDRPVKSFRDFNFFVLDSENLILPERLKLPVKRFIKITEDIGLFYPTVKIKTDQVSLKYDEENRFVIFYLTDGKINYEFGILHEAFKTGKLINIDLQLKSFHDFIYGKLVI